MKLSAAGALAGLAIGGALSLSPHPAPAAGPAVAPSRACAPSGKLNYICGLQSVEDLVAVPDGPWIVGSSFRLGGSGAQASPGLYLINTKSKTARPLAVLPGRAPKSGPFAGCPAPNVKTLNTHGLELRPGLGDVHTLYAVNHSGRESVEVFRLDARSASPTAIWTGCILMPKGAAANSVAALPHGRIAVTKFQSARSPDAILDVLKGAISGAVYVWTPGAGFKELPGSQLSGNNGLVASPDGRWLFVNAYGGKAVYRFALNGSAAPRKVAVDIRPDNIRWGPGGKLLITGQFITPETLNKPHGWAVLRLDPQTLAVSVVMKEPPRPEFDDATTAIAAGGQMWLGTFRGDRIAYTPLN